MPAAWPLPYTIVDGRVRSSVCEQSASANRRSYPELAISDRGSLCSGSIQGQKMGEFAPQLDARALWNRAAVEISSDSSQR
mmetsp:Transcript_14293/g.25106  ORF Transcript_14293/g.25106 Transcript_14293/m.25106 type:complete len:81 (+) Transcript_14293:30-272(+)